MKYFYLLILRLRVIVMMSMSVKVKENESEMERHCNQSWSASWHGLQHQVWIPMAVFRQEEKSLVTG
jgi:hypothetical protein